MALGCWSQDLVRPDVVKEIAPALHGGTFAPNNLEGRSFSSRIVQGRNERRRDI